MLFEIDLESYPDYAMSESVSSMPAGTVSANKITWSLGTLTKGATVPITLTVKVRENVQSRTEIEDI